MDEAHSNVTWENEIRLFVDQNGVSGLEEFLKTSLTKCTDIVVNFAITGNAGTGKSTFINVIRGLKDDEDGAAKTGVTQTTTKPACYDHPTNPKIKFWDLPGIGTKDYPNLEMYCKEVNLENYDTFLILGMKRFTQYDLELARKIKSINKNFFFIRTHVDSDYEAQKNRKRCWGSCDEEKMLNKMRESSFEDLENLRGKEQEIFLISNLYPEKWDFARLKQDIVAVLPRRQKECLNLLLDVFTRVSVDTMRKKVEVLRGQISWAASKSAFAAATPIPFLGVLVDVKLIKTEVSRYRSELGLPQEGTPGLFNASMIKFCMTNGTKLLSVVAALGATEMVEMFAKCVPVIGLVGAGGVSYGSTQHFLRCRLDEMEETVISSIYDMKRLYEWKDIEVNIGITGHSDTGRSSFINAIRGLDDDDEKAAEVGVTETTFASPGVLTSRSTDIVERKVDVLRNRVWKVASASAAAALVPLPGLSIGVDFALIVTEISFYRSQLGLPEEGTPEYLKLTAHNQQIVKKFCFTTAKQLGKVMAAYSSETAVEEVTRFIPIIGSVIASGMSFAATYYFLNCCLEELRETALSVLENVVASSMDDMDLD